MEIIKYIGITSTGLPIVTAEQTCEFFQSGKTYQIDSSNCWYCRYSDFRRSTVIHLTQSLCRCPQNRIPIELCNQKMKIKK